jgi:hypothetical protein
MLHSSVKVWNRCLVSVDGGEGPPPGAIIRQPEGALLTAAAGAEAHWSLDALAEAARGRGIRIGRSQVRRILRREKVRWRSTHCAPSPGSGAAHRVRIATCVASRTGLEEWCLIDVRLVWPHN